MPEETALAVIDATPELANVETSIVQREHTVHLAARNPQEMALAKDDLQAWLDGKISTIDEEINEIEGLKAIAKKNKWGAAKFNGLTSKAQTRRLYYEKIREAVAMGFTIVPNFPVDIFAIRVVREGPVEGEQYGGINLADYRAERSDVAVLGEGKYVSPKPKFYRYQKTGKDTNGKEYKQHFLVPTDFQNAEFPIAVAHPVVMQATSEAMALQLFDRIGICPQSQRQRGGKGDPLIIGQILQDAPRWGEPKKVASFLIAWHLDLRTL
jgi:hypothetical protein